MTLFLSEAATGFVEEESPLLPCASAGGTTCVNRLGVGPLGHEELLAFW